MMKDGTVWIEAFRELPPAGETYYLDDPDDPRSGYALLYFDDPSAGDSRYSMVRRASLEPMLRGANGAALPPHGSAQVLKCRMTLEVAAEEERTT